LNARIKLSDRQQLAHLATMLRSARTARALAWHAVIALEGRIARLKRRMHKRSQLPRARA